MRFTAANKNNLVNPTTAIFSTPQQYSSPCRQTTNIPKPDSPHLSSYPFHQPHKYKYLSSKIKVYQYQEACESEIITFVNMQILVQFAIKFYKHILNVLMCMYTHKWTWHKRLT